MVGVSYTSTNPDHVLPSNNVASTTCTVVEPTCYVRLKNRKLLSLFVLIYNHCSIFFKFRYVSQHRELLQNGDTAVKETVTQQPEYHGHTALILSVAQQPIVTQ